MDYVINSTKLAHDPWCLGLLLPKVVIFQRDNSKYIKKLISELSPNFPKVQFKIAPIKRFNLNIDTSYQIFKRPQTNFHNLDKIEKRLILTAKKSKSQIGKISALLTYGNKILLEACNSPKGEHAEILILSKIRIKKDANDYTLYVLIPPCIMCAKIIFQSKLKNISFIIHGRA